MTEYILLKIINNCCNINKTICLTHSLRTNELRSSSFTPTLPELVKKQCITIIMNNRLD